MTQKVIEALKGKSSRMATVSILLGLVVILAGFQGEPQAKIFHGLLGAVILVSGAFLATAKNLSTLKEIGICLIWAGWLQLPTALGGLLISPGPYYGRGLGALLSVIMIAYAITGLNGLYMIFYANKETGVPTAP